MATHLFSTVDDILWVVEASSTGPANDRVVARGSVGNANGRCLLNWLAQSYTTQQQLPAQKRHHHLPSATPTHPHTPTHLSQM